MLNLREYYIENASTPKALSIQRDLLATECETAGSCACIKLLPKQWAACTSPPCCASRHLKTSGHPPPPQPADMLPSNHFQRGPLDHAQRSEIYSRLRFCMRSSRDTAVTSGSDVYRFESKLYTSTKKGRAYVM